MSRIHIQNKYAKLLVDQEKELLESSAKFYKKRTVNNPMYSITKRNLLKFKNRSRELSSIEIVPDTFVESKSGSGPKDDEFKKVETRFINNKLKRLQREATESRIELEYEKSQDVPNRNVCKYLERYNFDKKQELRMFVAKHRSRK
jgi:hypothetical protein